MSKRKMLTEYPDLIKQWDYSKNDNVSPTSLSFCSGYIGWWMCEKGHSWKARVADRQAGTGCPYCSGRNAILGETDLATLMPEIASQWDYEKNYGRTPSQFTSQSNKEAWWRCKSGHSWKAPIYQRYIGRGCPFCSGTAVVKGINDLQSQQPLLAGQWDSEKNQLHPDEVHAHSNKYAWWICHKGHSWNALINNRTSKGRGCPYCSGYFAIPGKTDLLTLCPKLASEWDYEKNTADIRTIPEYSHKKAYWICDNGHSWIATVNSRRTGKGCPYCAGQKAIPGKTDLLTLAPKLAKEWDYEQNTVNITDLTLKSNIKVWWVCDQGHRWKTHVYVRAIGCGCPYCDGKVIYSAKNVR